MAQGPDLWLSGEDRVARSPLEHLALAQLQWENYVLLP